MAKYEIDLREQVGQRFDPELKTEVDVHTGQYSIMLGGDIFANVDRKWMEIGLVVENAGSPINFLPPANKFSAEDRKFFADQVKEQLKAKLAAKGITDTDRQVGDPPTVEDIEKTNKLLADAANGDSEQSDEEHL